MVMIAWVLALATTVLGSQTESGPQTEASSKDRVLFAFDKADDGRFWQAVNDGVMGGRSSGRFKISEPGVLEFSGKLSLENNGGFASIRTTRETNLELEKGASLRLRVRGDGRPYNLNLYVPRRVTRNSYRQSFETKAGEWIEVELPLNRFLANYRGREFPNEQLDPTQVTGIGIQLSDKKPGSFQMEVEWIKMTGP